MSRPFLPLVAALTLIAFPAATTTPVPSDADDFRTTVRFTAEEGRAALAYWTPTRMRAVGESVDLGRTGPMSTPSAGPMPSVGRLFFVNADGADTWCTATAVRGGNRSIVLTAGHCVRRGSSPANTHLDLVFAPGYANGHTRYGTYPVRAALSPRGWAERSVDDMAALTLAAGADGRRLTDVVDGQAVAFDRPVTGRVTAFGYPATRPQRGEEVLGCTGPRTAAPDGEQRMPCDLGGGASGGPWFASFDPATARGVVVSVNSHGNALEGSTLLYGPFFGAEARQVYERAQFD